MRPSAACILNYCVPSLFSPDFYLKAIQLRFPGLQLLHILGNQSQKLPIAAA